LKSFRLLTAGRLIRTLVNTSQPAGTYNLAWDGKNEMGEAVAGGLYFYRLQAGEETLTGRVLRLR
jgi:flagellar hook assembly protein FlgD